MSLEEILKAVIVCSANDGSVALAEHLAGSEAAFVEMMNNRAAELGMKDTVFANCTGLPTKEEHLTSAHDVALMSRALIKHDMVKKYTTIWMDTVRNGEFGITNTNRLVRFFNGTTGLKTGFTEEAMYCLSATAEREELNLSRCHAQRPPTYALRQQNRSLITPLQPIRFRTQGPARSCRQCP